MYLCKRLETIGYAGILLQSSVHWSSARLPDHPSTAADAWTTIGQGDHHQLTGNPHLQYPATVLMSNEHCSTTSSSSNHKRKAHHLFFASDYSWANSPVKTTAHELPLTPPVTLYHEPPDITLPGAMEQDYSFPNAPMITYHHQPPDASARTAITSSIHSHLNPHLPNSDFFSLPEYPGTSAGTTSSSIKRIAIHPSAELDSSLLNSPGKLESLEVKSACEIGQTKVQADHYPFFVLFFFFFPHITIAAKDEQRSESNLLAKDDAGIMRKIPWKKRKERDHYKTVRRQLLGGLKRKIGIRNPFDISEIELSKFGWIRTLKYPMTSQQTKTSVLIERIASSKIWGRLQDHQQDSLAMPALLDRFLIGSGLVSRSDLLASTRGLVVELCVRQIDFLAAFTTPQAEAIVSSSKQSRTNLIRIQEIDNLLDWFLDELEMSKPSTGPMIPRAEQSEQSADDLSPIQSLVINYLKRDLGQEEESVPKKGWIAKPTKAYLAPREVSVLEALETQLAITILGSYYKALNPTKWHIFFLIDPWFVHFFLYLKACDHHNHFPKMYANERKWAALELFPWAAPVHFNFNDKLLQDVAASVLFMLKNVRVDSIKKHLDVKL
ncbi:hypothetical protein PGTUg99_005570 [Puccinia graminis f. sp. tritici]|uniref:Uncharacterized protein n=1 Tax=Puccinia graminis f. sp. tritici TaxID=56615 RepID=A0A5B0SEM9_PUCGR|nr:hypothetical protein PGTUg99_005570 [Puccinia graminis f. sp. tritici]